MSSSVGLARAWICGVSKSSAKMKVFAAEVVRTTRSAAARGELADLLRARKGCYVVSDGGMCCDVY